MSKRRGPSQRTCWRLAMILILPLMSGVGVLAAIAQHYPDLMHATTDPSGEVVYQWSPIGSHTEAAFDAYCSKLHLAQPTPELDALAGQQLAGEYAQACAGTPIPEGAVR